MKDGLKMNIIPLPNGSCQADSGHFALAGPGVSVSLGGFGEEVLRAFLERTGLRPDYRGAAAGGIALLREDAFSAEEYELAVSSGGIHIKAGGGRAVIYALATVLQLMAGGKSVPCCVIRDKPRLVHRGLSLDCARHFFPAEEVKRIIEQLSLVKMNVLHWHLTDDQAWRIESKRFPELHRQFGGEFSSQEAIREIVAYAEARGVDVIPEIDMPGHVSALLSAYPEYSCSGKQVQPATIGGIYPVILCAGAESTYTLIGELLDELCPLFPSRWFHIGGDEAPKKEWKSCPRCQQKMKDEGLENEAELQGYFSNRVIEMLRAKDKGAICYNESLDAKNTDREALIQYWTPSNEEKLLEFAKSGGKYLFCDMYSWYLDYPHSMTSIRRMYREAQAAGGVDLTHDPAMYGMETLMWTENNKDAKSLEEHLFPRVYAAAEVMWSSPGTRDYEDFEKRLRSFLELHHPAEMTMTPENWWNPEGEARRNEALAYMAAMMAGLPPEVLAETMEHVGGDGGREKMLNRMLSSFFRPEDMPIIMELMGQVF
jgi:hexosaminidase